jgi:hypothetical protein
MGAPKSSALKNFPCVKIYNCFKTRIFRWFLTVFKQGKFVGLPINSAHKSSRHAFFPEHFVLCSKKSAPSTAGFCVSGAEIPVLVLQLAGKLVKYLLAHLESQPVSHMRFHVLTAVKMTSGHFSPEDGGSMSLRNVSTHKTTRHYNTEDQHWQPVAQLTVDYHVMKTLRTFKIIL